MGEVMDNFEADAFVDITDVECPVTFVKVQVAIEKIEEGQTLEIKMNAGRPAERVPHTLRCEGHELLRFGENADGTFTAVVRKSALVLAGTTSRSEV